MLTTLPTAIITAKNLTQPHIFMSTLDAQVAAHLLELRAVPELSADLRALTVSAVKQLDIGHGRKALLVFVPPPQLKLARKLHARIVRELEKKFSSQHVLIVAQRRILRTPARNARIGQMRPRSRTLTAVHENMLQDMVFPAEIVGKRTKVRVDGSKIVKVRYTVLFAINWVLFVVN